MLDARILALQIAWGVVQGPEDVPPLATKPGGLIASGTAEGGVPWCVLRGPIWGAANGYVYVAPEHPLLNGEGDAAMGYLDIPGGMTYANHGGWIGFDTCHGGDVWPEMPDAMKDLATSWGNDARHWDDEKVEAATRRLAEQIATCNRLGLWEGNDD